jgi:hypothetical protein
LEILTAVAPAAVIVIAVLNSRIRPHQQLGERFLHDFWVLDLIVPSRVRHYKQMAQQIVENLRDGTFPKFSRYQSDFLA